MGDMGQDPRLRDALKYLSENYPDFTVGNDASVNGLSLSKQKFSRLSKKRNRIYNVNISKCDFENIAFTGSHFTNVYMENSHVYEGSLAASDFYHIIAEHENTFEGSSFSQSNFTSCKINEARFVGSGFMQAFFNKSTLSQCVFQSSTLESCRFEHCKLINVDMGGTNVEYVDLLDNEICNAIFPFYQFAYVIGAADLIAERNNSIFLRAGKNKVDLSEYMEQIDNLLLYYYDKGNFFPACNLSIAKRDFDNAKEMLLSGINIALEQLDFRMIMHYCKLAQRHSLLDEITRQRIWKKVDSYLMVGSIPPERLNDCIIHAGNIKNIIYSGSRNSVCYMMSIRTNVRRDNEAGTQYVNDLCNRINNALSVCGENQDGFNVSVSNFSPYEIYIAVVTTVDALVGIAGLIWAIISDNKASKSKKTHMAGKDLLSVDAELYKEYIDTKIKLYKMQLQELNHHYARKQLDIRIEEITQKLSTDIEELYDQDVMIFKKENKKGDD